MKDFFRGRLFKAITVVVVIFLVGMIIAASTHSNTGSSSFIGMIISPFQKIAGNIGNSIGTFFSNIATAGEKSDKIKELEDKIAQLESELVDYESLKIEVSLYKTYLEIKEEHPDYVFAFAEVVGLDSANAYGSFMINKGSLHGISVNDPVVSDNYLVGIVYRVEPTYCVVKTILDPSVNVASYDIKTREYGYTQGEAALYPDNQLRLSDLASDTSISIGSMICTSGLGGVFPRDLIIGKVTAIEKPEFGGGMTAVIEHSLDISDLKEVFVITEFSGKIQVQP
ncbi:MAG: rod shape-determining protein MreC [Clostridia bacterium]|nr:rod shape-determining protein MreC [Clostridia bacterium]